MDISHPDRTKCLEAVYTRDTYRRTGGRLRFRVHYLRHQCARAPRAGTDYCWQHQKPQLLEKGFERTK